MARGRRRGRPQMRRGGRARGRRMQQGGHTHSYGGEGYNAGHTEHYHSLYDHINEHHAPLGQPWQNPSTSGQKTMHGGINHQHQFSFDTSTAGSHQHRPTGITPRGRMRRGGRPVARRGRPGQNARTGGFRGQRRMLTGGSVQSTCPGGNYGTDQFGNQICL